MKLVAFAICSRLGHFSPKTQPLTQSTAQFTDTSAVISPLLFSPTTADGLPSVIRKESVAYLILPLQMGLETADLDKQCSFSWPIQVKK